MRLQFLFSVFLVSLSCMGNQPVYVSTKGNDTNDGSLKHPLLTLEKARDVIRQKKQSGEKEPFSILLRGGDYYFTQTIEFEAQDQNLSIAPYKNEKVRFTGGISIDPSQAKPIRGTKKEMLFPATSRQHILMVDLKKLGISNYGSLKQVGFNHPLEPSWMEIFINGKPGHLSRWPNDSTVAIGKVLEKGSIASDGDTGNIGGRFQYSGNRPSNWKMSDDIWIFGYFHYGWADDAIRLAPIDTVAKIITTMQPHLYGFFSDKEWNRWYAYNIPEEIDTPGEYYIDRNEGIAYFYDPGNLTKLEISVLEKPFISLKQSFGVCFDGITFACSRGIGVEMISSQQCILRNCILHNLGSYAVTIYDQKEGSTGKENGVIGCSIFDTGAGGVQLSGGDRHQLEAAHNSVQNCRIYNYNRIYRTYCAGVKIMGVGNHIAHCEIYDSPHFAIQLSGNDHLIEYNNIHDVCQSTEDTGAFYYGRNPSERGNQIQYNFFHQIGSKLPHVSAIYHDDGACGLTVTGNIFYKAGSWTSQIGGGSDNSYTNNIFIDCPIGFAVDNRLDNWAKDWLLPENLYEKSFQEIQHNKPPYSIRYPELAKYWKDNPALPKRNRVDKNVFVRVGMIVKGNKKWLEFSDNNLITNEDPGFVDEKEQNFSLKESSDIFNKVPGFQAIPFNKMGCNNF